MFPFDNLDSAMKANPSEVSSLALVNQNLSDVPAEIWQFKHLKFLNLANNPLRQLPALKQLYLYWNKLESLPASIGQLKKLEILQLCKNHLHNLPESLQTLSLLRDLDLHENPIPLALRPIIEGWFTPQTRIIWEREYTFGDD